MSPSPDRAPDASRADLPALDGAAHERDRYRRQLRTVAENATLALFVLDERQQCTYLNPAAERLTGYTLADLQGRALHDVIHHTRPDGSHFPIEECPIDRAFPQDMRESGEEVFVHRDGSFYEVAFTASPIREDGVTVGTIIEVRDIREDRARQRERERLLATERAARIRAEESERRFRDTADAAPVLIWTAGTDARCDWFNRPWLDYTGRTMEQELGDGWAEGVHPDDLERCLDTFRGSFRARRPFTMHYRLRRHDGAYRWMLDNGAPRYASDGEFLGFIGSCVDIADQRAALEALEAANVQLQEQGLELELTNRQLQDQAMELEAQAEELQATAADLEERTEEAERARAEAEAAGRRLAFLAEASARLSSSLDVETTIRTIVTLAVPTIADWAAYNVDAGDGTVRTVAIHHPDPRMRALAHEVGARYPIRADDPVGVARVLRTGEPELIPEIPDDALAAVAHDAEHLRVLRGIGFRSLMNVPLVTQGRIVGVLGFGTGALGRRFGAADLAFAQELARRAATAIDHARLFAEAQRAQREAEAASHAKSEFLSTMSHELRTPLNAIQGYTELLMLGLRGPVTEAQRQDLDRVRRASQHLLGLITDILNFARLEAGQVEYQLDDVPLAPLVADLEALVGPQLAARRLAFEHDVGAGRQARRPHVVRADAEKLMQILLNLLTNAAKFTDAGGRVALAVEDDEPAGLVRVRVSDTGRGIAPEHVERIFDPFVQVDRRRTHDSQQGVGLGLSISRDLARGMGGDISVESAVGLGSTFTLSLPRA